MVQRVAILGGGVGGLSAAHELIRRGFDVDVYESCAVVGGKARSMGVDCCAAPPKPQLPGEHGFRFFPGFYKHLPLTMSEIAVGAVSARDHLVSTTATLLARTGGAQDITTPNAFPTSLGTLIDAFKGFTLFYCDLAIPRSEVAHFIRCLLKMLVSCDERRFQKYEQKSWWDFIGAGTMSANYKQYLAIGLSRSLVALNAKQLSARTGACILLQFLLDFTGSTPLDRVLDLPTNDAWLTHWHQQLHDAGVVFHFDSPVVSFQTSDRRISSVTVNELGTLTDIIADFYIAAFPVEVMQAKLTPGMIAIDPSLNLIKQLKISWMTGIIFYLGKDVPIVHGHANYLDSAWALTSISQPQFWGSLDLSDFGDGSVLGILSVIISNWDAPLTGSGSSAKQCSPNQVKQIVWQQLKDHLNTPGSPPVLDDADLKCAFIAPCLEYHAAGSHPYWTNKEPLLINTVDSWKLRPQAATGIENLYLASDYVQTYTDLATMESANEAARRAVNEILADSGSPSTPCDVLPMDEPALLSGYRVLDEYLLAIGLEPLVPPIPPLPWPCPP